MNDSQYIDMEELKRTHPRLYEELLMKYGDERIPFDRINEREQKKMDESEKELVIPPQSPGDDAGAEDEEGEGDLFEV